MKPTAHLRVMENEQRVPIGGGIEKVFKGCGTIQQFWEFELGEPPAPGVEIEEHAGRVGRWIDVPRVSA